MNPCFAVTIDFDGTIADLDITDAVIKKFAKPEWEAAERLWEEGTIGSKECLFTQMSLIDAPLEKILEYMRSFSINGGFVSFVDFLRKFNIPFGIISDGIDVFVEGLLADAGLRDIPVYANRLGDSDGGLKAFFPYASKECSSGMCKCKAAKLISHGLPVIHIGDGRSDFCLAEKALYLFSKGKLTDYCRTKGIPHHPFDNFKSVERKMQIFLHHPLRLMRHINERNELKENVVGYGT